MAKKPKDDEDDIDEDIENDSGDKKEKKKGGKGKLIAIIGVAVLIILGGAGGGLFYMGYLDSLLGMDDGLEEEAESDEMPQLGTPVYYELPEFVADLYSNQCRSAFVKLSLTLQVDELDKQTVIDRQPKIIDRFQQHLRSKIRQDLSGKDGAETLRTELTLILDATIKPAKVQNVLFRSLIVQ
jgi:flagellar protein FliL